MSLYSKFLKTEMTETDLYNLVLTDQRTHSGPYYMEQHGFDRLLLHPGNGIGILLQAEKYKDNHYHISIQGNGRYVMFNDKDFVELLKKF